MGMAERIRDHLGGDAEASNVAATLGPFTVKISGCPNSCGQHHVGDLGLTGHLAKMPDGSERPVYSILVGGSVGEGRARIGKRIGRFPEEDAPAAIAALARLYERERLSGEPFPAFVDRIGADRLRSVADEAARAAARA
jgi:sulfite reductase beta subunit-like hemoprotein